MCSGVYRLHCEGVITTNITRVVGGDAAGLREFRDQLLREPCWLQPVAVLKVVSGGVRARPGFEDGDCGGGPESE